MKQRGFTLVELLAVIIILSLLLIIVIPKINDGIKSKENEVSEITKQMIFSATGFYLSDLDNEYIQLNGNSYCIKVIDLINMGYLKETDDLPDKIVKATYNNLFTYELVDKSACTNNVVWLVNDFVYTGSSQTYIAPVSAYYKIELWGAQGGNATYTTEYDGGKGAYTKGIIYLERGQKLTITVGGKGHSVVGTTTFTKTGTGFNGGAPGSAYTSNSTHGGGGGATDVRFRGTTLNDRIMVAGGGGGASSHRSTPNYSGDGGAGGDLYGKDATSASSTCYAYGSGSSQTLGGSSKNCEVNGHEHTGIASFGLGYSNQTLYSTTDVFAGGGAGYYGGGGGFHASGGGGSSFISGYAGVNAIESATSLTQTNNTLHYSGKYFIAGQMSAGENSGDGKAKITIIGSSYKRVNAKLNNVRYIKNCTTGNSTNNNSQWAEIQVIYKGNNIARTSTITGTSTEISNEPYSNIIDGDIELTSSLGTMIGSASATGKQCITLDLFKTYNVDEVAVWHYWKGGRTYYDNTTSVSSDNINWTIIDNREQAETSLGFRVSAYE